MSAQPKRVGVTLTPIGNRSGTGFYTERLLQAVASRDDTDLEIVPILLPKTSVPEDTKDLNGRRASTVGLRWPFHQGSNFLSRAFVTGLDAIHYPSGVGPPQTVTPIVATIHDVSPFLCPETFPRMRAVYLRRMFSAMAQSARLILTDTHWQAERVGHVFPEAREKVRVVYPAADPLFGANFPAGIKESSGREFLLAVGTLEPRKNVLEALLAWQKSEFDADLFLVGRWGWKCRPLRGALDSLGAWSQGEDGEDEWHLPDGRCVRHFDFVPKKRLASMYRGAFCLLYPSRFEGFGLPVLEAMMSGCPVLTHRDSAMEEVIGKAGWYFDQETGVGSLSDVLREMSLSAAERQKRVEAGKARARDFDDVSFSEGICSAYVAVS